MPVIESLVMEKWTNNIIPKARVFINDNYVMESNENGTFAFEIPNGSYKLCVLIDNYENNCQTVNVISNMKLNIFMVPVFRSL